MCFFPQLSTELKILAEGFVSKGKSTRKTEVAIRNGCLKTGLSPIEEVMHLEDLAAMEKLDEDMILTELHERLKQGHRHTFVGDVLLVLTSNEQQPIYNDEVRANPSLVRNHQTHITAQLEYSLKASD
jgi:myosin heavy subunit